MLAMGLLGICLLILNRVKNKKQVDIEIIENEISLYKSINHHIKSIQLLEEELLQEEKALQEVLKTEQNKKES